MNTKLTLLPALVLAAVASFAQTQAPAQTKVGIIHIQNALIGTKDGQKAAQELEKKRAPRTKELEGKQNEINLLKDKLSKGANTLKQEERDKLVRDIDTMTKSFNRELEDTQAEWDQEQGKILQELGQRIMTVIDKYARDNGYAIIIDISSQQTPVLYAANSIDITQDIIRLYDQAAPATPMSTTSSSAVPATPATAKTAPAPVKKAPGAVK